MFNRPFTDFKFKDPAEMEICQLGQMNGGMNSGLAIVRLGRPGSYQLGVRKELVYSTPESAGSKALMRQEVVLTSSLRHPNIIEFLGAYIAPEDEVSTVCIPTSNDYFQHRLVGKSRSKSSLFVDLCDLGDLNNFAIRARSVNPASHPRFPTAFVWHLLEGIVSAVCHCQYGVDSIERLLAGDRARGWDPVLHLDIHPGNIFLKTAQDGKYPVVKLADFGVAIAKSQVSRDWRAHGANVESNWNMEVVDEVSMLRSTMLEIVSIFGDAGLKAKVTPSLDNGEIEDGPMPSLIGTARWLHEARNDLNLEFVPLRPQCSTPFFGSWAAIGGPDGSSPLA